MILYLYLFIILNEFFVEFSKFNMTFDHASHDSFSSINSRITKTSLSQEINVTSILDFVRMQSQKQRDRPFPFVLLFFSFFFPFFFTKSVYNGNRWYRGDIFFHCRKKKREKRVGGRRVR